MSDQTTQTPLVESSAVVRRLHSFPVGGEEPLHICSPECWCYPVRDTEQPGLWVHNAKDCREAKERAGRTDMLAVDSLWVLALENVKPNVADEAPASKKGTKS